MPKGSAPKILELSQAKKVVVTEQKAQGNELFSFDFSILWVIVGLSIEK